MNGRGQGYVVHEGCDHIFFIGFLGAGKSTLARNLGALFRRSFAEQIIALSQIVTSTPFKA